MKFQNLSNFKAIDTSLSRIPLKRRRLNQQIARLWQVFISVLSHELEPKVTWKRNRQGVSYLRLYDPRTGQHHYFASEQEARIWLEQSRYASFQAERTEHY